MEKVRSIQGAFEVSGDRLKRLLKLLYGDGPEYDKAIAGLGLEGPGDPEVIDAEGFEQAGTIPEGVPATASVPFKIAHAYQHARDRFQNMKEEAPAVMYTWLEQQQEAYRLLLGFQRDLDLTSEDFLTVLFAVIDKVVLGACQDGVNNSSSYEPVTEIGKAAASGQYDPKAGTSRPTTGRLRNPR